MIMFSCGFDFRDETEWGSQDNLSPVFTFTFDYENTIEITMIEDRIANGIYRYRKKPIRTKTCR